MLFRPMFIRNLKNMISLDKFKTECAYIGQLHNPVKCWTSPAAASSVRSDAAHSVLVRSEVNEIPVFS